MSAILWFRRDLRLSDHPALMAAAAQGPVLGLFVVDPQLWRPAGAARLQFLAGCLRELRAATGGALVVRHGDPAEVVPSVARLTGAGAVFVTDDHGPYGSRRDRAVSAALGSAGASLTAVGSNYAVAPGTVTKADDQPYRVYSPFYRAWRDVGWPPPSSPPEVEWLRDVASEGLPEPPSVEARMPPPGEVDASDRLRPSSAPVSTDTPRRVTTRVPTPPPASRLTSSGLHPSSSGACFRGRTPWPRCRGVPS